MPKVAIRASATVAEFLRERRKRLGLSLREVEERTRREGEVIPFSTLARVEKGRFDPGLRRLHALFRIYEIDFRVAEELLDLEELAGELPATKDPKTLYEEGLRHWKAGDLRRGLAHLLALRAAAPDGRASRAERQKRLLSLATVVGSLGRYRLSRQIVEELLLEPPEESVLVRVLVQAADCWNWLGSGEAALGFLSRAEAHVPEGAHRERAWVFHERASTLASLGRHADSADALNVALAAYRTAKDTHGEGRALGVAVRLRAERQDWAGAAKAARAAREHAVAHGHARLRTMRTIDLGRALIAIGDQAGGLNALNQGLSESIAEQDSLCQFYAHFYLWKAHLEAGNLDRAEVELGNARYHLRFVDEQTPETIEVRSLGGDRAVTRKETRARPKKARRGELLE